MEKVGTSNPDRTISLEAAVRNCINKQTLHKDHYTYLTISLSVLHRIKNASDKFCKDKTHFVFSNTPLHPPPPENRAVYEIMWKIL